MGHREVVEPLYWWVDESAGGSPVAINTITREYCTPHVASLNSRSSQVDSPFATHLEGRDSELRPIATAPLPSCPFPPHPKESF